MIFNYLFLVFLPYEFCNNLNITGITKRSVIFVKMLHRSFTCITLGACHRLTYFCYFNIMCCCQYPLETLAIWIFSMRLILCPYIHPNPGPTYSNNFAGGFLSFCNWNLNTLSKDDFTRITLLEAHNTE